MDIFLLVVSIVTGISTLTSFIYKLYSTISNMENKLSSWENTMERNTLYILKLALFTEGLSVTDRNQAGQQYLEVKKDFIVEKK